MTFLEYWETKFPDFMAKASKWEKELLAQQNPEGLAIFSEQELRRQLELLKDFDLRKKEGRLSESIIYKRYVEELSQHWDSCAAWNGLFQFIAAATMAAGLAMAFEPGLLIMGIAHMAGGLGLALFSRAKIGLRAATRYNHKRLARRFGFTYSEKAVKEEARFGAKGLFPVVYIPLNAIAIILSGLFCESYFGTWHGIHVGAIGFLLVLGDFIYFWHLLRKNKKEES